jgi:hypothetical protein
MQVVWERRRTKRSVSRTPFIRSAATRARWQAASRAILRVFGGQAPTLALSGNDTCHYFDVSSELPTS